MMNITYHTRGFILLSQFRPQKCTEKIRKDNYYKHRQNYY